MNEPQIKGLSYKKRQLFFFILVGVFVVALPVLIFYTTGYRLNFDNEDTNIVLTGGMYITTDTLDVDVFLDGVQIERPRLFRSAYYIENIREGKHRVVVQRPDLITWVKELPVYPHLVIEAAAFNLPVVPHLRPVTKYLTATGTPVYVGVASSTDIFPNATTTVPILKTLSLATTTYDQNEEFPYVQSLFSTSTNHHQSVFSQFLDEVQRFRFATTAAAVVETGSSTLPVRHGNLQLVKRDGELYAQWLGSVEQIPFYFCVAAGEASTTAELYGQHVADQIAELSVSTTTPLIVDGDRICRPEIKLNRLRKDVYFYDFFPHNSDLVLLQLEDGLYVTEIDDRSWQNVQLLYPGSDFQTVVDNDRIYVHDGDYYFEVITKVEPI